MSAVMVNSEITITVPATLEQMEKADTELADRHFRGLDPVTHQIRVDAATVPGQWVIQATLSDYRPVPTWSLDTRGHWITYALAEAP